jgi:hypothetical protein
MFWTVVSLWFFFAFKRLGVVLSVKRCGFVIFNETRERSLLVKKKNSTWFLCEPPPYLQNPRHVWFLCDFGASGLKSTKRLQESVVDWVCCIYLRREVWEIPSMSPCGAMIFAWFWVSQGRNICSTSHVNFCSGCSCCFRTKFYPVSALYECSVFFAWLRDWCVLGLKYIHYLHCMTCAVNCSAWLCLCYGRKPTAMSALFSKLYA